MSVSMKSTKAVMYSEIERLRALLDAGDAEIALLRETVQRRDAEIAALRAERSEAEFEAAYSEPREVTLSKMEIARRLAILMKRTVRPAADGKFESYVDKTWVTVPERVVRFATEG